MRSALLVVLILAVGCTRHEATVLVAPPRQEHPVDARGPSYEPPAPLVAPVYPLSRPATYVLAVKAALAYFRHIDERDAAAGRLLIHDKNAWYGPTDVVVLVSDAGEGRSRVELTGEGERPRMVLEKYLERLDLEVQGDAAMREATDAAPH